MSFAQVGVGYARYAPSRSALLRESTESCRLCYLDTYLLLQKIAVRLLIHTMCTWALLGCTQSRSAYWLAIQDQLRSVLGPMGCSWLYAINGTWVEYLKLLFDWPWIETDLLADIVVWRTSTHISQGKRVFIKDMAYYLFAPDSQPTTIAQSLGSHEEPGNPTNIPLDVLRRFHFTFLIRHPRRAIPSYFRCTVPPLDEVTGFYNFTPSEAGYVELVRLFDFLIDAGIVDRNNITVIDADDMLDNPESIIRQYCDKVGLDFKPEMLEWNDSDREHAAELFAKWDGFHNDAIKSSHLRARSHAQKMCTEESENKDWVQKFGPEAQKVIRETVNANIPYYDYLRSFCLKV